MKVMMLLLVSAAALLVSPAHITHKPEDNLNHIIHLVEKFNMSLTKGYFVEDVTHLFEAGCDDKFFCKVYDILHEHEAFGKMKEEKDLVRNLKIFVDSRNPNCTVLKEGMTPTGITSPIPKLVDNLTRCIKRRNFNAATKSNH